MEGRPVWMFVVLAFFVAVVLCILLRGARTPPVVPPPPVLEPPQPPPEPPPPPLVTAEDYYPLMTPLDLKAILFLNRERNRPAASICYPACEDTWWQVMSFPHGLVHQTGIWLQRNASAALACPSFDFGSIGLSRKKAESDERWLCEALRLRLQFFENLQLPNDRFPGRSKARIDRVRQWWLEVRQRMFHAAPDEPYGDLTKYDGIRPLIEAAGCSGVAWKYCP